VDEDAREAAYLGLLAVLVVSWLAFAAWSVWQSRTLNRDAEKFRATLAERADFGQWESET
jgi:hypothetical protein